MSVPSAICIDKQGSLVATMGLERKGRLEVGPNTDVNITSNTGILKNMFDRIRDLVSGEHPVLTIETTK